MIAERRRYAWMDKAIRPPLYEYTWNRVRERALEGKQNMLTDEEKFDLMEFVKGQAAEHDKQLRHWKEQKE